MPKMKAEMNASASTPANSEPSQKQSSHKRKNEVIVVSDDDKKDSLFDEEDSKWQAQLVHTGNVNTPQKRMKTDLHASVEEKRPGAFRKKPPQKYLERLERAQSQRMFLLDRKPGRDEDDYPMETFSLAGTTGNIYEVQISRKPTCNCPDSLKGNQCKHIIYILTNVLKARDDLAYQLYFLSSELKAIFENAPDIAGQTIASKDTNIVRRPVDGDCPICMVKMNKKDDLVWCKTGCGNNLHSECFKQWAKHKIGQTRCVLCRTPWITDLSTSAKSGGTVTGEGYRNIAQELNISGERDTSTYYEGRSRGRYGSHHHGHY